MPTKDSKTLLDVLSFQISIGVSSSPVSGHDLKDQNYIQLVRKGMVEYLKHGKKSQPVVKQQPAQASSGHQSVTPQNIDNEVRKSLQGISTLQELKDFVCNFSDCELKKTAANTVFCDGTESAKIMLIGEAPGETEDEKGIPFCGKSGILLDKAMEAAGFSRKKNLYITNTIFCRPPGNRKPTEEETKMCRPIVEKHIALIDPKIIILCGSTAIESLLGKNGITKMNGTFESYSNQYIKNPIIAAPIFHPSFLLRNPIAKKQVWLALLKIRQKYQELGLQ